MSAAPVLLLHGWPDDPRTYDAVAPRLHAAGLRTITPWLRGFGETAFLSPDAPRSGEIVAMARDALDLLDALGVERVAVVGHDWGARIAYALSLIAPERVDRIATIAVGWAPGELATPPLAQVRAYWYQWLMCTDRGAAIVRERGAEFSRTMWDTWSPPGWFTETEFAATARSFENPDWADVTLHSYRVRWGEAAKDPSYAALDETVGAATRIPVPTLMLHGGDDRCTLLESTGVREELFPAGVRRVVLDGVGHFATREAPEAVGAELAQFLTA